MDSGRFGVNRKLDARSVGHDPPAPGGTSNGPLNVEFEGAAEATRKLASYFRKMDNPSDPPNCDALLKSSLSKR